MSIWDDVTGGLGNAWDQFTGHAGAQAARKASGQLTDAYNKGLDVQQQQYQQGLSALSPYSQAGQTGLQGQLAGLSDPNSFYGYQFQQFDPNSVNVQQDPGYQFRLQQGLDSAMNSQAGRGLQNSGGALKELNNYAQGQASQEYNNAYGRQYQTWQGNQAGQLGMAQNRASGLAGLSNMGYNATTQGNQLGQNYGNQFMQGQMGIGDAQAARALGVNASLAGGAQNFMDLAKQAVKGGAAYYTGGLSGLAGSVGGQ
jgi:hypothetical protein